MPYKEQPYSETFLKMMEDFNSAISAEIVATCGAIGYNNKGKYVKDPDCSECLKDLIRFLRNDDESHSIRRQLARIGVLKTDLIPLLKYYPKDKTLFDINIRLLINLTNPVMLLYHEELPEEKLTRNYYMEILSYQQECKQSFTDPDVWKELANRLRELLQLDWEHCQEDDRIMIERILILIRNILHIPSDSVSEKRTDDDVSIHDQIVWSFHISGMDDLIIYLAVTDEHKQFCFHVLEIISLLLREQTPQQLASTGQERFTLEKQRDNQELLKLRKQEFLRKQASVKLQTSRHSRFGGTFEVKNMKSVSDNNMLYHHKLQNITSLTYNQKEKKRKPKRNVPMQHVEVKRKSALTVRLCLRDFCKEFLDTAYNLFMKLIKEYLMGNQIQANDETYYFWAIKFFMEFNRLSGSAMSLITETMSIQSFHYLQTQIEYYYEMTINDKKKIVQWSKRMHLALKAYQELLLTLYAMDESSDREIIESAKIIKGNIFYVMEYRELLISLLMNYDEVKFSQNYLKDLIETTHVFMKMLEKFCKRQSHLIVQQKKVKRKKKNKPKKTLNNENKEDYEKLWSDLSENLSTALQEKIEEAESNTSIFDPVSDHTIDQQRINVIIKIKETLQMKNVKEAICLLRAARNIWPENDVFGIPTISPENEFIVLREIYFSDVQNLGDNANQKDVQEFEDNMTEEEQEERIVQSYEKEFDFKGFVSRFANSKIVRAYAMLFKNFNKNSDYTNNCILKMLHRISWDCKMVALLFQASVFQTMQKILDFPEYSSMIKELKRFSKFVVRKFFETAEKNNKVFVEILFWKKLSDIYEIENGYGTTKPNINELWNEEQEDELRNLYQEYENNTEGGKDVIDHILEHMIDQTKTRRQVIRKLKQLGIVENAKQLHKQKSVSLKRDWTEEETTMLIQLYEKYKDSTGKKII
ncbi:protein timeless homolog isoform X1 [Centruroides sculpturatus]|uniref:protein timeless homolog isoform X1 n=4 Tax=Centruroides sculpturatus TaxID=218467 RepID=UPI000C6E1B34|nr:protein timeless homolog isoform X1 [Centruroides sculpturatus]